MKGKGAVRMESRQTVTWVWHLWNGREKEGWVGRASNCSVALRKSGLAQVLVVCPEGSAALGRNGQVLALHSPATGQGFPGESAALDQMLWQVWSWRLSANHALWRRGRPTRRSELCTSTSRLHTSGGKHCHVPFVTLPVLQVSSYYFINYFLSLNQFGDVIAIAWCGRKSLRFRDKKNWIHISGFFFQTNLD